MQDLKINFDDKKMDPQVEFQLRNPLNWILYYFIGKSEQGFAEMFSWTVVFNVL